MLFWKLIKLSPDVFEVELDGKLEIELYGGALVWPPQSVANLNVYFRSVEGPIARIQLPVVTRFVQNFFQLLRFEMKYR